MGENTLDQHIQQYCLCLCLRRKD